MIANRSLCTRLIAVTCFAMLVVVAGLGLGCSSSDDIVNDATAAAVEAGLNNVLTDTVEPLVSFLGTVPTIVGGGVPRSSFGGVLTCPNSGDVCGGGGSLVCTVTGGGLSLTFDFDECVVVTGDLPFTLDGGLVATPGVGSVALNFNSLFINNSPATTGTGSVNVNTCTYVVNVTSTDGASVIGTIIQCDADNYPTAASHLTISLENFVIDISFNGSVTASAAATSGGNLVANCSINLDALSSSCDAP